MGQYDIVDDGYGTSGGYPEHYIPNSQKDKDWCLRYIRQMYSDFNSPGGIITGRQARFLRNRRFAEALQDPNRYKEYIISGKTDQSFVNIDWQIASVIPKIVNTVIGDLSKFEYELVCNAIDQASLEKRREKEHELKTKNEMRSDIAEVESAAGMEGMHRMGEVPESDEERNLYMNLNYKQESEIMIENGVDFVKYKNDWQDVYPMLLWDALCCNEIIVRSETDRHGRITMRRVDPGNAIFAFTNRPDGKNLHYCGEIVSMTLPEIREIAGDMLTETEYLTITKMASSYSDPSIPNSNAVVGQRGTHNNSYSGTGHGYTGEERVNVVDTTWMSVNKFVYEKRYNKYGTSTLHRKDENWKPKKGQEGKRERIVEWIPVVYKGKWVYGTDIIFDWGHEENVVYHPDKYGGVKLPFHVQKPKVWLMDNKSLVEAIIPFANLFQVSWLKLQSALAKAAPNGLAIEVGGLENVLEGWSPLQIREIYSQTGDVLWRKMDDDGQPLNYKPIEHLPGGAGPILNELMGTMNFCIDMMRLVSGVNEARDGSKPHPDALVGVQKLMIKSSNNATQYILHAIESVELQLSWDIALRIQDLVKHKKLSGFLPGFGDRPFRVVEVTDDVSLMDFDFRLELKPTEEERQHLEGNIQQSIANGELEPEDGMIIRRVRNVKQAEMVYAMRRRKKMRERAAEAAENARLNAEAQQQSVFAKAEMDRQMEDLKAQNKLAINEQEHQMEKERLILDHDLKVRLALIEQGKNVEFKQKEIDMTLEADAVRKQMELEANALGGAQPPVAGS